MLCSKLMFIPFVLLGHKIGGTLFDQQPLSTCIGLLPIVSTHLFQWILYDIHMFNGLTSVL